MQQSPTTIGVLIASYLRPVDLIRCLDSLKLQTRRPDDVLVVLRSSDAKSQAAYAQYDAGALPLRLISVDPPGLVFARNRGISACQTDILAMVDDDTVPHPVWLERVLDAFQRDETLGGLGGRDRCFKDTGFHEGREKIIGKLQWFGRVVGNHHLGFGEIRSVDVLKGANMSYRAAALKNARADVRLRGEGAQPSEDISLSLAVSREGWKLAYDPEAVVDHYSQRRPTLSSRGHRLSDAETTEIRDFAYNEVVSLWDSLTTIGRFGFFLWSLVVGSRACPGFCQAIRFTPALGGTAWTWFKITQQGKWDAFRDLMGK